MTGWIDEAKRADIGDVARQLGLQVRHGSRVQMSCPACGATRRGKQDRRLPVNARDNRWKCWACEARGDVIDMVSFVVAGARYHGQPGVKEWFEGIGVAVARVVIPKPSQPRYPPSSEVIALLRDAAYSEDAVCAWLAGRFGIHSGGGRSYCIDEDTRLPWWAAFKGPHEHAQSWYVLGYRLIFPVFDSEGRCRSVRARMVCQNPDGLPKTLPPAGYDCGGLVLASKMAIELLNGDQNVRRVIIAEGEPDFLAWQIAEPAAATFGIGSGWWTQGHADKIPTGADVLVATHNDEAGDKYAAHVIDTLGGRCVVTRWRT